MEVITFIGSNLVALMAGATPKITPTNIENPNDNPTDQKGTVVVKNLPIICYHSLMKRLVIYFFLMLSGLIIYLPSLKYGFSQDDFIHLFSSKAGSLSEFLNFFNPFHRYPDIFFYRPLTTQVYFFLNHTLFGLNPIPYHLEALILHIINSFLFFIIIRKIWGSKQIAFYSALFYTVSAAHFLSLYYISAFQEIGRTFFIFLSLILFFNYQESRKKMIYICSLIVFIAALLSKETSLITPLLIFPLEVIRKKDQRLVVIIKNTLKLVIPFLVIAFIYILIRLSGFQSIFNEGAYNTTFSVFEILQNLKWYIIWSFGLPEILSTYPSLSLSWLIQFGKDLPFANIVLILTSLLVSLGCNLFFKLKFNKRIVISSLIIFLISLTPVLILQGHRYPQYLDLAFLGFLPILAFIFYQSTKLKKFLGFGAILIFIALQFFSLQLSQQTHWTTHRANIAEYYYQNLRKLEPKLSNNTTIIFVGTNQAVHEVSLTLAQKYAPLVWFPNKIKKVDYTINYSVNSSENTIIYPITIY